MAAFIVIGELGTGKTIQAVAKIREALQRGVRVATNIDLRLESLVGGKRKCDLTRLPDWPKVEDFRALGDGATVLDEKMYGWIVLDEAAVFLNAREWAGSVDASKDEKKIEARARVDLIAWLRHARKHRWHLILLSQDLESLDAQVRRALAQFVVQCKRLDSYTVPIVSTITKSLGLGAVRLPQMHVGMVRLGSKMAGPPVDKWWLPDARSLHGAYNTEQKIYGDNDGAATMLDSRRASYLWKPRGWREWLWEAIGWRWWPPSAARSRYDDSQLGERGLGPSWKQNISYEEWAQARAVSPSPQMPGGVTTIVPARLELVREAA